MNAASLLDLNGLAALLGMSKGHLMNIRSGETGHVLYPLLRDRAIMVGRYPRWRPLDVQAWIDAHAAA